MSINHLTQMPLGLAIQRGNIPNFSGIQKFGYNTAVGTSFETIWENGSTYSYPTSATTAVATSSDTSSDNDSTVHIYGLDSNYDLADEVITVGGSASTTSFIRVFRSVLTNANTGVVNVGKITTTVNSLPVSVIDVGYGQSLQAIYTIPRNYRGYLMSIDVGTSKQKEVQVKFMQRPINGNTFQTKSLITTFGTPFKKDFLVPAILSEKSDLEIRAKADATTAISAGFQLILEKIVQS
uniref:Uncharacterized protein n=1 Tax=uncultured marine virus TaxID=186617 RepID=A0A0F7L9K2_9VIRU|nr:hypothetical protein SRSM4_124 [uncultured marine virus]